MGESDPFLKRVSGFTVVINAHEYPGRLLVGGMVAGCMGKLPERSENSVYGCVAGDAPLYSINVLGRFVSRANRYFS